MAIVTADTNILVSALNFGGVAERFLSKVVAGEVELAISEAILTETRKVLRENSPGRRRSWTMRSGLSAASRAW